MTPARFASCIRLLHGIKIQTDLNRIQLNQLVIKRDHLRNELVRLARFIGDDRFADTRLLLSMSRRIGLNTSELKQCEQHLAQLYKRVSKLSRSKSLLTARIRKHETETEEQDLMEATTARISLKLVGQSATRNKC
jgi:hypothetical protein